MELETIEGTTRKPVPAAANERVEHEVLAVAGSALLPGTLMIPPRPAGLVLVATSGGASHRDAAARAIAHALYDEGLAVLSVDLLTADEAHDDVRSESIRNDLPIIARRIEGITDWLAFHPQVQHLPLGYLGSGTTATDAMLEVAAARPMTVQALVLYDPRPDLVTDELVGVTAPVLAIVGDEERPLLQRIGESLKLVAGPVDLEQALDDILGAQTESQTQHGASAFPPQIAVLASDWFHRYLPRHTS